MSAESIETSPTGFPSVSLVSSVVESVRLQPVLRVLAFVSFVSFVVIQGSACARPPESGVRRVRIAVGGQHQLIYLPATLARELGFYREEGLDVELQDHAGGSKALQAVVGGSADVVCGYYDHTIQMAAEDRALVAFVTILRFPGLVLVTAPTNRVTKIEDLKGRVVGVTTPGSSSHMLLTFLLHRHGVPIASVSVTGIGGSATAVAAVEHGKVDAGMMSDPALTIVQRRAPGVRVLADLRHADGLKHALDATSYPASVLYSPVEWVHANRDTAARLARAIKRTLEWMQTHSAEDIADRMPAESRGADRALYVEALNNTMEMYSPDGVMPADGPKAVHALLAQSLEKVKNATIDLSKTYTNEFVSSGDGAPRQ
jgi:NitT/TauT family transport system substrate-binding protein